MKNDLKWTLINIALYTVLIVHIIYMYVNNRPKSNIYYAVIFTLILIYKDIVGYRKANKDSDDNAVN